MSPKVSSQGCGIASNTLAMLQRDQGQIVRGKRRCAKIVISPISNDRTHGVSTGGEHTDHYTTESKELVIYRFDDYLRLIYPNGLEVKNSSGTKNNASYLVLHLAIYNEGRLRIKFYDKLGCFFKNLPPCHQ